MLSDFRNCYVEGESLAPCGFRVYADPHGYIGIEQWFRDAPDRRQLIIAKAYDADKWLPMIARALRRPGWVSELPILGQPQPGAELRRVGEFTAGLSEDGVLRLGKADDQCSTGPQCIEVQPEDQEWVLKALRRAKRRLGLAGRIG